MIEAQELKENLSNFLNRIGQIKKANYDEKLKNSIYRDYKELYHIYSQLTKKEIIETFSTKEIKAINCLSLGLENEHKFNELILNFEKSAGQSMLNIIDFISSRAGFDLINKESDFSKFKEEELVEIFGSLFGIQITKECVKSLKAEKIGRVMGYAMSGLFEQHIIEFREAQALNPHLDLCSFIKEKVQIHDNECTYTYNEIGNNLEVHCDINRHKNASLTDVRGNNKIDHCFVNDEEKTIVFGQSTSNKDTEEQGYSFFKGYYVLKKLVALKEVDGAPNPYYGYKLKPYLMLGGRFVVDNNAPKQEIGKGFKKMFPKASKEDFQALAQMQYFRYYGNAVNAEQVNSLPLFTVFMAGCDMFNIYQFSETTSLKLSEIDKNKACFELITKQITKICNILSQGDLTFVDGGKNSLLLTLKDIEALGNSVFVNFNYKINEDEYIKHIQPLHKSLDTLVKALKPIAGQFGNKIINDLSKLTLQYRSTEDYNQSIEGAIISNIENVKWLDKKAKEIFLETTNLKFIKYIGNILSDKMSYTGQEIFNSYLQAVEDKLKGYPLDTSVLKPASFRANISKFLKNSEQYQYKYQAEFIKKTRFMLDERLTTEKHQDYAVELIKYVNDLRKVYPEMDSVLQKNSRKKIKTQR